MMHTPGPWMIEVDHSCDEPEFIRTQIGDDMFDIATLSNESGNAVFNARLIAAAPDMLEALMEIVAEWDTRHADEDHRTGYTLDTGGIAQARAVIARATGGQ